MWTFYHASPYYNTERIQAEGLRGHELMPMWIKDREHLGQPLGNYLYECEEHVLWYTSHGSLHQRAQTSEFMIWAVDISGMVPLWDPEAILLNGEVSRRQALSRRDNVRNYPSRWYIPQHIEPARLSAVYRSNLTVVPQLDFTQLLPNLLQQTYLTAHEYPAILRRYRLRHRAQAWEQGLYGHQMASPTVASLNSHEFSLLNRLTTF